jgi:hypothetical protein
MSTAKEFVVLDREVNMSNELAEEFRNLIEAPKPPPPPKPVEVRPALSASFNRD